MSVSDLVAARHRSHGVEFIFGATVSGSSSDGVRLSNGADIAADLVLVGIGVEPVATVAERLGLPSAGGITVDAYGRTAAAGVYCAGDAALQFSRCHSRAIRVETWANAQNQAIAVAGNMIDRKGPGITLTTPLGGGVYQFNKTTLAAFVCVDGGSGLATCTGTAANGAAIATSSMGTKSFVVTATDAVGNTSSTTVSYTVAPGKVKAR